MSVVQTHFEGITRTVTEMLGPAGVIKVVLLKKFRETSLNRVVKYSSTKMLCSPSCSTLTVQSIMQM